MARGPWFETWPGRHSLWPCASHIYPLLVLVKPVRLTRTDCDSARDYVVPYVLSPRNLVSIPDNMDEAVLHTRAYIPYCKF